MPIFSSTIEDLQSEASFHFAGDSDIQVLDDSSWQITNNDFSMECWFKTTEHDTHNQYMVVAYNTVGWFARILSSGPTKLNWYAYDGSTGVTGTTVSDVTDGNWHHVIISFDRSANANMYIDGVLESTVGISSMTGSLDSGNNLFIGSWSGSVSSHYNRWDGEISSVRLHNRALTADEVVDAYNGQNVPYKFRGASQTQLIADNFSTYGADDTSHYTNGWVSFAGNYTVSRNSNGYMQIVAGSGSLSNSAGFYFDGAISGSNTVIGKRYRVEVDVWATGDSGIGIAVDQNRCKVVEGTTSESWVNASYIHNGIVTNSSQTFSGEIIVVGSNPYLYINGQGTNSTVYVDNLKVTQVGCIAEFLPSGISADRWVDTSGNDLHGTVTGAIATNHKRGSLTTKNIKTTEMDFSGTPYSGTYLSSYEQGTWSPVLKGTTSGTESTGTGTYTRIGNLVCVKVHYYKAITSGTLVGNLQLTGFPYAPISNQSLGFLNIRCGDQGGSGGAYAAWGILGTNGILNLHPTGEMNYVNAHGNVAATYPVSRIRQNGVSTVIFNWEITYLTAVTIQAI